MNRPNPSCSRYLRSGLIAILPLLLLACAFPTKAAPPEHTNAPARLTITGAFSSVDHLLATVGQTAKIPLRTRGVAGWPAVVVYARDTPATTLLPALATLFNYQWNAGQAFPAPSGDPNLLTQPGRAREYDDRLWREHLRKAGAPLFQFARSHRTPPEQWKKQLDALKGTTPRDPFLEGNNLRWLAEPAHNASLELLDTLTPSQQETLLLDEQIVLPGSSLAPRQWQVLRRMDQFTGPRYEYFKYQDHLLTDEQVEANLERKLAFYRWAGLPLKIDRDPTSGVVSAYYPFQLPVPTPPADFRFPVRGCPYLTQSSSPPANPTDATALGETIPFPGTFKPPMTPPGKPAPWSQVMQALAASLPSDYVLLSDDMDSFQQLSVTGVPAPPPLPSLSGKTLEEGLDALCASQGRLWWRDGKTLFFRSRIWFVQQRYQVPPPALARLRQVSAQMQASTSGTPAFADASRQMLTVLADLTREQLMGLVGGRQTRTDIFAGNGWSAKNTYPYLRLFQMLTSAQQQQLLQGKDITLQEMTPAQQQAFLSIAVTTAGIWVASKTEELKLTARLSAGLAKDPESTGGASINATTSGDTPKTTRRLGMGVMFGFHPQSIHAVCFFSFPEKEDETVQSPTPSSAP